MGDVKYGDFKFPKEFGFTGSTGKTRVSEHLRAPRGEKYIKNLAKGGRFAEEHRTKERRHEKMAEGGHYKEEKADGEPKEPKGFHEENREGEEVSHLKKGGHHKKMHHKAKGGRVEDTANRRIKGDDERTKESQDGARKPNEFADFKHGGKAKKHYAEGGMHEKESLEKEEHFKHGGKVGSLHHKHHFKEGGKMSVDKEEEFKRGGRR